MASTSSPSIHTSSTPHPSSATGTRPPPSTSTRRRSSHTLRSTAAGRRQSVVEIDEEDEEVDPFLVSLDDVDFDASSWINAQLDGTSPSASSASASLQSLDSSLSGLLTKISLARTDVSTSIDREIAAAKRSVPRIVGDLGWIGKSVEGLGAKLDKLGQQVTSSSPASHSTLKGNSVIVDNEPDIGVASTNESQKDQLDRLADLHKLHTHLTSYRALLRLASSWSTLSSDVSLLLSEASQTTTSSVDSLANFNSASLRLKEARESLEVFGSESEGKDKAALLGRLTDSFEAAVGPKLVAKVRGLQSEVTSTADATSTSTEALEIIKSYASVLTRVGRGAAFGEYWRGTRRQAILEHWSKAQVLEDQTSSSRGVPPSPNAMPLSVYLPTFFSLLSNLLATERQYIALLYPANQSDALDLFLSSTLSNLKPSLKERVASVNSSHQDDYLIELLKIVRTIRERGREMERTFARLVAASTVPVDELDRPGMKKSNSQTSNDGLPSSPTLAKSSDAGQSSQGANGMLMAPLGRRPSSTRKLSLVGHTVPRRTSGAGMDPTSHSMDANGQSTQAQATAVGFEFTEILYSSLLPVWNSYPESEVAFLRSTWSREMRTLPLFRTFQGADGAIGDETLGAVLNRLQRSFTIMSDASEDALSHCLELTRGLGAHAMLTALEEPISSSVETFAKEVEGSCQRIWRNLINPHGRAPAGREWTAFGRIVSLLAGLRAVFQKARDVQTFLIEGLKESATHLVTLSSKTAGSIYEKELADKLVKLKGVNGSGINGPVPTSTEICLLLNSSLASNEEEKQVREQIVTLAGQLTSIGHNGMSSSLPSATALARQQFLPLLPGLSRYLTMTLHPLLHSMLVLPLAPVLSLLTQYPSWPTWTSSTLPGQVSNEYQLAMPSFSLGPTEIMQTVGEGVLGLVRELESWMGEAGWKWGVELLLVGDIDVKDGDGHSSVGENEKKKEREKKERRRSSMLPPPSRAPSGPSTTSKEQRRRSSFLPSTGSAGQEGSLAAATGLSVPKRESPSSSPGGASPADISPPMSRLTSGPDDSSVDTLGTTIESTSTTVAGAGAGVHASSSTQQQRVDVQAEDLLPAYISHLVSFLTTHLLTQILPLLPTKDRITDAGWKQLEADLDWIKRILDVLQEGGGGGGGGGGHSHTPVQEGVDEGTDDRREVRRLESWRTVVGVGVGHPSLLSLTTTGSSRFLSPPPKNKNKADAITTMTTTTTTITSGPSSSHTLTDEFGYSPLFPSTSTSTSNLHSIGRPNASSPSSSTTTSGTSVKESHPETFTSSSNSNLSLSLNPLDSNSVRQMLQSQRRSGTNTPTTATNSSSRGGNNNGAGGGGGGDGRGGGGVDLSAMSVNVGMGW